MKAYSVSFTNAKPVRGRHHNAEYRSACIVATDPMDAAEQAEIFRKAHLPKTMHVEEIRLEDDVVVINGDLA